MKIFPLLMLLVGCDQGRKFYESRSANGDLALEFRGMGQQVVFGPETVRVVLLGHPGRDRGVCEFELGNDGATLYEGNCEVSWPEGSSRVVQWECRGEEEPAPLRFRIDLDDWFPACEALD